MKDFLSYIGLVILILSILGAFDIGDFRLYYGPDADAAGCSLKAAQP